MISSKQPTNRPNPSLSPNEPQHPTALGLTALAPVVFVLLWSTGFIGAKFGLPYAEPFTFLGLRFTLVATALFIVCLVTRTQWPIKTREWIHLGIVGLLMHGIYLGGVFASIDNGISAGLSALIVGLQPLLTASIVGKILGERVAKGTWLGLALGFIGVVMVVGSSIDWTPATTAGVWLSVAALVGLSFGVIYQKRYCASMNLLAGSCIQFFAAALLCLSLAVGLETREIQWTGSFVFALAWLVIVLSFGAMTLLWILIRNGAASKVSSLFYLVPGVVAVEAWALFDETLSPLALAGFIVAALGVWQISRTSNA